MAYAPRCCRSEGELDAAAPIISSPSRSPCASPSHATALQLSSHTHWWDVVSSYWEERWAASRHGDLGCSKTINIAICFISHSPAFRQAFTCNFHILDCVGIRVLSVIGWWFRCAARAMEGICMFLIIAKLYNSGMASDLRFSPQDWLDLVMIYNSSLLNARLQSVFYSSIYDLMALNLHGSYDFKAKSLKSHLQKLQSESFSAG